MHHILSLGIDFCQLETKFIRVCIAKCMAVIITLISIWMNSICIGIDIRSNDRCAVKLVTPGVHNQKQMSLLFKQDKTSTGKKTETETKLLHLIKGSKSRIFMGKF